MVLFLNRFTKAKFLFASLLSSGMSYSGMVFDYKPPETDDLQI